MCPVVLDSTERVLGAMKGRRVAFIIKNVCSSRSWVEKTARVKPKGAAGEGKPGKKATLSEDRHGPGQAGGRVLF